MTVNRKNYLIVWGILLSAGLSWSVVYWRSLPHLPDSYSGEAVYGKVVDADTGKPVSGAIVIGLYELSAPYNMEAGIISGHIHVEEVVTDINGNYQLAAWGPKQRYGDTYLKHAGPSLVIYKSNYQVYTNDNGSPDNRYSPVQSYLYSGGTIKLKKYEGDLEGYAKNLSLVAAALDVLLDPMFGAINCAWKSTPRIMIELDKLKHMITERGVSVSRMPEIEQLVAEGNCGTREEFIRRYTNEITDDTENSSPTDN